MEPSRFTNSDDPSGRVTHLEPAEGRALVAYARDVLRAMFYDVRARPPAFRCARRPGATFVTLHEGRRLQGCIGNIRPDSRLAESVAQHVLQAAFLDPRAYPLAARDVEHLAIELSLLGPETPIRARTEAEAVAALRPDQDGVILRAEGTMGLFLPQVWEDLPAPVDFLRGLKQKAGLPADYWRPVVQLSRFSVEKFKDPS